jgi:hypothetical protein
VVGHATLFGVVFLANVKVATFSSAFSIATVVGMSGSVILFLLFWLYINGDNIGVLWDTFGSYFDC